MGRQYTAQWAQKCNDENFKKYCELEFVKFGNLSPTNGPNESLMTDKKQFSVIL